MSARSSVVTDQVRTAVRFPMKLTLQLKTAGGELSARTENISANGILFTAVPLPPVGSEIEFTIQMPGAVMGRPDDVLIRCIGRVVRHQWQDGEGQAGAIIDDYSIEGNR